MLPKMIYELLPYMYLSVGIGSGATINSVLVFIGAVLLITTGALILVMRISYRRNIRQMRYSNNI